MKQSYYGEFTLIKIALVVIILVLVFSGCTTMPNNKARFECQDGYMYQVTQQKKSIIIEKGKFKMCDTGKIYLKD